MKNKKNVVKSCITLGGLGTLYLITIIAFFKVAMSENIFMMIFTLFTNVITSITTWYFARKENNEVKNNE